MKNTDNWLDALQLVGTIIAYITALALIWVIIYGMWSTI